MSDPIAEALAKLQAQQAEQSRQFDRLVEELRVPRKRAKSRKKRGRQVTRSLDLSDIGTPSEVDRAWARRALNRARSR